MRLIDADALKEKAFGKRGGLIHTSDIDEMPTAQPHDYSDGFVDGYKNGVKDTQPQRTGKWIDCDGSEHWKCDKCGCRAGYWFNEENSSSWELDMSEWLSDFCPNCGAKME